MALIDRMLLRNAEETARAEALREFRGIMPRAGRFSEVAQSGIRSYYDKRFGHYSPELDSWKEEAHVLKANPQLRRVDVIADAVFSSGKFQLRGLGVVRNDSGGMIAAISLIDSGGERLGMLTLDIGSEVRFTKLRIGKASGDDYAVRPSSLDRGLVLYHNKPAGGKLPDAISDRAEGIIAIFQTIEDAVLALRRLLDGKSA